MNALTGTLALVRLAVRRDRVVLPACIAAFAFMVTVSTSATVALYPTVESRIQAAAGINNMASLVALYGRIHDETSLGASMVALLGLFTVIRHTRAEEESGRLEFVGGAVVGRFAPLTAALLIGIGSSGLHSSGFSLVRKALLERGGMSLDEKPEELDGRTLGEELLVPTRIYTSAVEQVLGRYKVKEVVRGIAHITGGGLPGNIPRVLPGNVDAEIDRSSLRTHPVFGLVQKAGEIEDEEMFRVFNMGIGMVIICSSYYAGAIVRTLKGRKAGRQDAYVIGRVVEGEGKVRLV